MHAADFLHDLALFVIIAALLRLVTAYLLERNPESTVGKALAFIH
jgi:hypothetical protein